MSSVYQRTVDRLEPEVAMIDAGAYYASAAISLKRIADSLEKITNTFDNSNEYGEKGMEAIVGAATRAASDITSMVSGSIRRRE